MPYIKQDDRALYDRTIESLAEHILSQGDPTTMVGMLENAVLFILTLPYAAFSANYSMFNEMIGVLECAKLEFQRLYHADPIAFGHVQLSVFDDKEIEPLQTLCGSLADSVSKWRDTNKKDVAGQLNYIITRLLKICNERIPSAIFFPVEVLEVVKCFLYFNRVAKYEDIKSIENGIVSTDLPE